MTFPLQWAPPDTTGWTTLDATAGGRFTLDVNTDYIVNASAKVTTNGSHSDGALWIEGGRGLHIKGLHLEVAGFLSNSPGEQAAAGLLIQDHQGGGSVDGRIVHIEGLRIDGDSLTNGIRTDCPTAIAQIQNCYIGECGFLNCDHRDGTRGVAKNHPDILQTYGSQKELRVSGLTGTSMYQGIFLKEDHVDSVYGPMYLKHVNVHASERSHLTTPAIAEKDGATGYAYAGHRMMKLYPANAGSLRLDDGTVWVDGHPNNGWAGGGAFERVRYWTSTGTAYTQAAQHYGWNDGTVQGWTAGAGTLSHQTATVQEGTGAVQLEKAFAATGFDSVRAYDAARASSTDLSANGNTLAVRVWVPSGATGTTWRGRVGVYTFNAVGAIAAGALVEGPEQNLTLGAWNTIVWDTSSTNLSGNGDDTGVLATIKRLHFRVGADAVNATVAIAADNFGQGSYSETGSYTDEPVAGTGTDADAADVEGVAKTAGSDGTGSFLTFASDVVGWDGTGSGKLYLGVPSGGDYIAPADVGIGYVTPASTTPVDSDAAASFDVRAAVGSDALATFDVGASTTPVSSDALATFDVAINAPSVAAQAQPGAVGPGDTIVLDGTLLDDGGEEPSYTWEKATGPGDVRITDPSALDTTATIEIDGTYTFRLTALNSGGSGSGDSGSVVVLASPEPEPEPPIPGAPIEVTTPEQRIQIVESDDLTVDTQVFLLDENNQVLEDISADIDHDSGETEHGNFRDIHRHIRFRVSRPLDWGRQRIAPVMHLWGDGLHAEVPLGIFAMTSPVAPRGRSPAVFDVEGFDLMYLLNHHMDRSVKFDLSKDVLTHVRDFLALFRFHEDQIDNSAMGQLLSSPLIVPIIDDSTRANIVNDLLGSIGYRGLSMDARGRPTAQRYLAPDDIAPMWTYDISHPRTTLSPEGTLEADYTSAFNSWVLWIDDPSIAHPVLGDGLVVDQNVSDGPTSIQARGGLRIPREEAIEASSHSVLLDRAARMISSDKRIMRRMTMTTAPNPWHGHFDTMVVKDPDAGIDGVWQHVTWTLPWFGGDMVHELRSVS